MARLIVPGTALVIDFVQLVFGGMGGGRGGGDNETKRDDEESNPRGGNKP